MQTNPKDLMPSVRERAYFRWGEAGRPYGREHEFWAAASREIEAGHLEEVGRKSPSEAQYAKARSRL